MVDTPRGLYRGRVLRVDNLRRPYVSIPRLSGDYEYGPLEVIEGPWFLAQTGEFICTTPHRHTIDVLLDAGDRVLLGFLEGDPDSPIVLGRLK